MTDQIDIHSIGHSSHSREHFLTLLRQAGIEAIADVRSSPYSRYTPHFSQSELKRWLTEHGISYVFLGNELGGRPAQSHLYSRGVADYEAMSKTTEFSTGLERLLNGAQKYSIAMMCSEHDPLDCHRCLLVARHLAEQQIGIGHILANGEIASHGQIERRLLKLEKLDKEDFFNPLPERRARAYRQRSMKVAFAEINLAVSAG